MRVTEHRTRSGIAYSRPEHASPTQMPVVLIHGWCCDRVVLAALFKTLARSRDVVSLDLSGHGASAVPERPTDTIQGFAEDVIGVLDDAGRTRAAVVGHSMGGLVALEVAAAGRATGAVLLDPAPLLSVGGKRFFADAAPDIERDVTGAWRLGFIDALYRGRPSASRARVEALMTSTSPQVAAAAARAMACYDGERALRAVAVPVQVISAGTGERLDRARELCPTLSVQAWPEHHHFFPLDDPDSITRAVLAVAGGQLR
jgi:pimeloyl-ACP methyl ester carboxylesterase